MKRITAAIAALALLAIVATTTPAAAQGQSDISVEPFETYIVSTFEEDTNKPVIARCQDSPEAGIFDIAVGGGVLSPGGVESPGGSKFVAQQSYPIARHDGTPYGWVGRHRSVNLGGIKSDIDVFVVCMKVRAKPAEAANSTVPDDFPFDPRRAYVVEELGQSGAATARCEADDVAVGGGADTTNRYAIKRSFPVAADSSAFPVGGEHPTGWRATVRSVEPGDPAGEMSAFAVCVPLLRDSVVGPVDGPPDSGGIRPPLSGGFDLRNAYVATGTGKRIADAFCEDGDVALGGGGQAILAHKKEALKYMMPAPHPDGYPSGWNTATRGVDDPSTTNPAWIANIGYAICAPVAD